MSEVIISNNIEDYKKYIGITLRNKSGFPIANIVDVISYTNTWNVNKAVFVLDNGKKVFVNNTKMARRIRSVNTAMKVSRKVSVHDTVCNRTLDVSSPFAIGKSFYRDGEYVGTIVSKGCDDKGSYVQLNNGHKISTVNSSKDEFIDPLLFENGDDY